ncbi:MULTISPECIES: hypothetical protein [Stenotrophomonas]|jgi:hypothetical protein|uniref:DUF5625 domain-containing protein n=1 Tax=Stenotrophomonas pavanii TaxID=487698 RepID=A0A246L0E1_9GAMM|nr:MULTISPECIES: hypothetical protein [Stenotrophomonas]EAB7134010.1 hypothetical protein [Salmonella enterica subsp. enterica serovar Enteritidis]MBC9079975.1 hypothetical protein [Stenotrophomonas maltophilia]MBC9093961.1 hypothetical protein [Stenotrophomonas maltophilia]MBH1389598.1 hypothetical protein [Stenotrophomonas maltophilia]MBH1522426.1 hypothetical protein [Stenotrophomonas maltophilia]
MLGNHRWLRAGLLIMLSAVLGACSGRDPVPPEPLDLAQPIAVDQPGQGVSFEFEMNARNYIPHRTYAVELELQRQATRKPDEPDVGTMRIPFEVTLQQWGADAWKDVPTYDSYQAGALNAGEPLPEWHASSEWRYTSPHMGSDGQYTLSLVDLPVEPDTRYRVQVRTVKATPELQHYSAQLRVHAARPPGK